MIIHSRPSVLGLRSATTLSFCGRYRALLLALLASATTAEAYCPQRTCKNVLPSEVEQDPTLEENTCDEIDDCIVEGHQLFWRSKCIAFGVSGLNAVALGLEPEELRDIVEDAFKVWQGVDCGDGKTPGFSAQGVGLVDGHGMFFCEVEPTANLSVWSLATRWTRDSAAVGYTSSTINKVDGEIFDADVEFNLNKILGDYENNPADYPIIVGSVALHEAGHALGLAHSQYIDTVMEPNYSSKSDFFDRRLAQDDIDGICALYPPAAELDCAEPGFVEAAVDAEACEQLDEGVAPTKNEGCAISPPRQRNDEWLWPTSLLFVALQGRLRRRASLRA